MREEVPLLFEWIDYEPVPMVRQTGSKERGYMAWEAWVSCGLTRFASENGTYAWTRKGAERKAYRLLSKYRATRGGEPIALTTTAPTIRGSQREEGKA